METPLDFSNFRFPFLKPLKHDELFKCNELTESKETCLFSEIEGRIRDDDDDDAIVEIDLRN